MSVSYCLWRQFRTSKRISSFDLLSFAPVHSLLVFVFPCVSHCLKCSSWCAGSLRKMLTKGQRKVYYKRGGGGGEEVPRGLSPDTCPSQVWDIYKLFTAFTVTTYIFIMISFSFCNRVFQGRWNMKWAVICNAFMKLGWGL